MRATTTLALTLAFALAAGGAFAKTAPCRDTHGKFMKCPLVATQCRDAKGHFAKCGTPGAKPAGMKTMAPAKH